MAATKKTTNIAPAADPAHAGLMLNRLEDVIAGLEIRYGEAEAAGNEANRMVLLELIDQARGLHGRLNEYTRITAGFHGPHERFINDSAADRIADLRRQRSAQALQSRNYQDYADRVVS